MIPKITDPSKSQLIQYGFAMAVLFGIVAWSFANSSIALGVFVSCALVSLTVAAVRPKILRTPFIWTSLVTRPLGVVVAEAILLLLYFLVLTPIALVRRQLRSEHLLNHMNDKPDSNWSDSEITDELEAYYRQF